MDLFGKQISPFSYNMLLIMTYYPTLNIINVRLAKRRSRWRQSIENPENLPLQVLIILNNNFSG